MACAGCCDTCDGPPEAEASWYEEASWYQYLVAWLFPASQPVPGLGEVASAGLAQGQRSSECELDCSAIDEHVRVPHLRRNRSNVADYIMVVLVLQVGLTTAALYQFNQGGLPRQQQHPAAATARCAPTAGAGVPVASLLVVLAVLYGFCFGGEGTANVFAVATSAPASAATAMGIFVLSIFMLLNKDGTNPQNGTSNQLPANSLAVPASENTPTKRRAKSPGSTKRRAKSPASRTK